MLCSVSSEGIFIAVDGSLDEQLRFVSDHLESTGEKVDMVMSAAGGWQGTSIDIVLLLLLQLTMVSLHHLSGGFALIIILFRNCTFNKRRSHSVLPPHPSHFFLAWWELLLVELLSSASL